MLSFALDGTKQVTQTDQPQSASVTLGEPAPRPGRGARWTGPPTFSWREPWPRAVHDRWDRGPEPSTTTRKDEASMCPQGSRDHGLTPFPVLHEATRSRFRDLSRSKRTPGAGAPPCVPTQVTWCRQRLRGTLPSPAPDGAPSCLARPGPSGGLFAVLGLAKCGWSEDSLRSGPLPSPDLCPDNGMGCHAGIWVVHTANRLRWEVTALCSVPLREQSSGNRFFRGVLWLPFLKKLPSRVFHE